LIRGACFAAWPAPAEKLAPGEPAKGRRDPVPEIKSAVNEELLTKANR
jgi:hypothetical protein